MPSLVYQYAHKERPAERARIGLRREIRARGVFSALTGWEAFDSVDLESRILRDKEEGAAMRGYWLVGDYLYLEEWPIAIGEDASWVANLGSDGVARSIPESRRSVIIGALASLTNASLRRTSGTGSSAGSATMMGR